MSAFDLNDTTFLIPIRIESKSRLRNINLLVNFLLSNFNTNIIVLECDAKQKTDREFQKKVNYHFLKDKKNYFNPTYARNILTSLADTPIIGLWDADFVVSTEIIKKAVGIIRKEELDILYPYNGIFYETNEIVVSVFKKYLNTQIFQDYVKTFTYMNGNVSVGGGLFLNRVKYIEAGMENTNIKMWGPDDIERFLRFKNLGLRVGRLDSPAFHLSHQRLNACLDIKKFKKHLLKSKRELLKISNLGSEELSSYVNTLRKKVN